jgi:hypothetical protein
VFCGTPFFCDNQNSALFLKSIKPDDQSGLSKGGEISGPARVIPWLIFKFSGGRMGIWVNPIFNCLFPDIKTEFLKYS